MCGVVVTVCGAIFSSFLLGVKKLGAVILMGERGGGGGGGQRTGRGVVDGAAASCVEQLLDVMILP